MHAELNFLCVTMRIHYIEKRVKKLRLDVNFILFSTSFYNKTIFLHAGFEEMRNAYRILFEKPEGKRPHGRPSRKWEDNIRMNLREIG